MTDEDETHTVLKAEQEGLSGWRTALNNYRELLDVDNGLVWLINLATAAIGYGIVTETSGLLGTIAGAALLAAGLGGIADSILGRVRS